MTSSILIIGINPSNATSVRKNSTFDRLIKWVDHLEIKYFSFFNVIPYSGPYTQNMVDISTVSMYSRGYTHVIALGEFVSKALQRADINHYTMPHPSPLNRLLNSREYEMSCLSSCKNYLES